VGADVAWVFLVQSGKVSPPVGRESDPHMLIPFGIGETMLGFVTVERRYEKAWLPAEVRAVELIAADIGRALHHARLYESETRLVAELRRVDEAKSYFLATISHELRPEADAKGVNLIRETPAAGLLVNGDSRKRARVPSSPSSSRCWLTDRQASALTRRGT
jgi:hypothetical protein